MIGCVLLAFFWCCASSPTGAGKQDTSITPQRKEASPAKGMPDGAAGKKSAPPSVKQDVPKNITYYTHTVRWSGETVSIIAGWYTGDIEKWNLLAEANPDMDPNVVIVGQMIRIPEHIMTTRSPMTKAYVDKYYPKPRPPRHHTKPPEKKDDSPVLFGPK